jgi:hypothetical protein
MTINLSRRGLLGMLAAGVGAAIVSPGLIMPIKPALTRAPIDWNDIHRRLAERLPQKWDRFTDPEIYQTDEPALVKNMRELLAHPGQPDLMIVSPEFMRVLEVAST